MKRKILTKSLLILMIIYLFHGVACSAEIEAKARYVLDLKDKNQVNYKVYIYSNSESKEVTNEENAWAAANAGDIIYAGDYRIALRSTKSNKLVKQGIKLNGYFFNASRNMVYVVKAKYKQQPDILVIAQHGNSSNDEAKLFYIKNEKLHPIKVKYSANVVYNSLYTTESITNISQMQFKSLAYYNADPDFGYNSYVWKLDISSSLFKCIKHKNWFPN